MTVWEGEGELRVVGGKEGEEGRRDGGRARPAGTDYLYMTLCNIATQSDTIKRKSLNCR